MSNKRYIYGEQFAQKLPGSNQDFYFRTVTGYLVDNNGKPIKGSARTDLYYAPKAGATDSNGETWTPGKFDSISGFNPGGWVMSGSTSDNGRTYNFHTYTQEDANLGKIPSGKKVGDIVLGATTQQSLTTSGGRFYEAVQNNLINLAVNTEPGLAQVVSAKQENAVQQQQQQQQQGSDPTKQQIKDAFKNLKPITIEVGTAIARDSYGKYYYPADLETNGQDRIVFKMFKYAPATLNPILGQRTITRNISQQLTGSVTLPITGGISDSNSVDWSGATINPVQAMGAAAALKLMNTKDIEQFGEVGGQILSTALNELTKNETYGEAFKVYLAQEAVGIQNLLSRASGAILNPNMELLFNGPSLRSFNYQFKMSPRDVKEAKQVRSIIRFFKQGMSVKTTEENVFLKAPNVFSIEYLTQSPNGGFINHPSINIIKKCALISCDVNYTPDGTYMTYDDDNRTMTSYELTLRFGELEPIYDEDYNIDGNEDLLIGY